MKNSKDFSFSDEIFGKETMDYIEEFSPHRLSLIRFEENSEKIFEADEENLLVKKVMKL